MSPDLADSIARTYARGLLHSVTHPTALKSTEAAQEFHYFCGFAQAMAIIKHIKEPFDIEQLMTVINHVSDAYATLIQADPIAAKQFIAALAIGTFTYHDGLKKSTNE